MSVLVSGSIAYDFIMDYNDSFKNHIMPDKIHFLSLSFTVNDLKRHVGGTGGNICYNLCLLGEHPVLLGAVGQDFDFKKFHKNIVKKYIYQSPQLLTASAYIVTDMDNNQITAFYQGAMELSWQTNVEDVDEDIEYGIISPCHSPSMIKHLKGFKKKNIKTFFDPGQLIPTFLKQDFRVVLDIADYLIVNEYELALVLEKTKLSKNELFKRFEKVIVTLGAAGVDLYGNGDKIHVDSVKTDNIADPTGAGDAFRAGLLKGLRKGFDRKTCLEMGCLVSHFCIQKYGTQTHGFTIKQFEKNYKKVFNKTIKIVD